MELFFSKFGRDIELVPQCSLQPVYNYPQQSCPYPLSEAGYFPHGINFEFLKDRDQPHSSLLTDVWKSTLRRCFCLFPGSFALFFFTPCLLCKAFWSQVLKMQMFQYAHSCPKYKLFNQIKCWTCVRIILGKSRIRDNTCK